MRQHKKTERKSNFEKCFRILEYLRRYSDREHRLDQADLRKVSGLSECIGDKGAFNDNINAMAIPLSAVIFPGMAGNGVRRIMRR